MTTQVIHDPKFQPTIKTSILTRLLLTHMVIFSTFEYGGVWTHETLGGKKMACSNVANHHWLGNHFLVNNRVDRCLFDDHFQR